MLSRKTSDWFTEHYEWSEDIERLRNRILTILDKKTWNDIWKWVEWYVEVGMIEKRYNNISQIKKGYQRLLVRLFW